jgi:bifunctional non-homologous end joining protein LigD
MKKKIKIKPCVNKSRFVLQDHHASHQHYDFRLEKFGTLKSWALPRGLPTKVGAKHIAIQTPNHPLDYISFEGTIPKGNYGAGTVTIADYGCYEPKLWNDKKIEFILYGRKYKGKYIMVPFAKDGQWLIIKGSD